jgi:serralysin
MNWPLTSTERTTATLLNNVAVGNADCGINLLNNLQVWTADYNDASNNKWDYCGLASSPVGTHSLSVDPRFVSAAANDYHIRFGSPAMNTGTSVGAPAYDKDGVTRPQMGRVDMGAYEVVAPYSVYLPAVLK